jgi:hypothetical protein
MHLTTSHQSVGIKVDWEGTRKISETERWRPGSKHGYLFVAPEDTSTQSFHRLWLEGDLGVIVTAMKTICNRCSDEIIV